MQHPDQKYIEALLNNDAPLVEEIYSRYSGKIKLMVLQNNGSESDAADIFQDALISIYNKAKTSGFTLTCPFDAFLYLVCKNKWLNELNKKKTRKVTFTETSGYKDINDDSVRLADECVLREARNNLLARKFEELGDGCKKLLRLSWSGKSMEEVARLLNVTYGYARKKKSECLGKLAILVKESSQYNSLKW